MEIDHVVAPSGSLGPDEVEGFPLVETFQDCCGETRQFEVTSHVTEGGYFLRAAELPREEEGYRFAAHHPSSPWVAMGILRRRIAAGLATRYLASHEGRRCLGHDRAVGHVGYGCVVIDGQGISFDEFTEMLQTYEGWHFEIRIEDGFDVL